MNGTKFSHTDYNKSLAGRARTARYRARNRAKRNATQNEKRWRDGQANSLDSIRGEYGSLDYHIGTKYELETGKFKFQYLGRVKLDSFYDKLPTW